MTDRYERIRAQHAPEPKYGCYCDLERHMEPDGCVIDEGKPENCIYARGKTCKTQCEYWKHITRENNVSAGLAPDAGLAHPSPADEAVQLLKEIKAWDVSHLLMIPHHLRVRIQAAIDAAIAQRGEVSHDNQ